MPWSDPERARAYSRAYRATNKERVYVSKRAWQAANRAKLNAQSRARYAANPIRHRASGRAWAAANPDKRRASNQKWYRPERRRAKHLKLKYRMTIEQWDIMLAAQDGRCAICRTEKPGGPHNKWQLDHDHNKPKGEGNRGLLCVPCNRHIVNHRHNPTILRAAADYLERRA